MIFYGTVGHFYITYCTNALENAVSFYCILIYGQNDNKALDYIPLDSNIYIYCAKTSCAIFQARFVAQSFQMPNSKCRQHGRMTRGCSCTPAVVLLLWRVSSLTA